MATCGELLVRLLEAYGVELVFGIPGVHTVELYRGLPKTGIRHVTPRHEQGAGFMADGYARVTGKPGVCFIITGPGMTNILTAMGQAYGDSVRPSERRWWQARNGRRTPAVFAVSLSQSALADLSPIILPFQLARLNWHAVSPAKKR
jgi:glyoxylate carboligase